VCTEAILSLDTIHHRQRQLQKLTSFTSFASWSCKEMKNTLPIRADLLQKQEAKRNQKTTVSVNRFSFQRLFDLRNF